MSVIEEAGEFLIIILLFAGTLKTVLFWAIVVKFHLLATSDNDEDEFEI